MRISVIVPTLNAGAAIGKLLSKLLSQDIKPLEIIIIDSSSEDNTVDIAKGLGAKTIVIPRHSFNHGKTRNTAAVEATGDILVFVTQDALPMDNTLLNRLTEPLERPEIAAAYGRHIPKDDALPLEVFARHFNYPEIGAIKGMDDLKKYGIKTFFFSDVCSAIKTKPFLKVGMFPEGIKANEDMLISAKLIVNGYKVAYVPEAKVIHSHHYSLLKQFRRYFNIGSSLKGNRWIFNYARPEGEGLRFIKEQIRFVVDQRRSFWIPYIFLESVTKYAGFKIGLIAG